MPNPFEMLFQDDESEAQEWEEVEGSMDCNRTSCLETVHTGRYYPNRELLIYECSKGHKSEVKM